MRKRHIYHSATGGTVGSSVNTRGVRDVDPSTQSRTRQLLERIPFTRYSSLPVAMRGDSSAHPREHLLELRDVVTNHVSEVDGMLIEHGTDTMNLTAATLALAGNEIYIVPVTLLGSIRGPQEQGSDAPENTITAGFFTAFGDASGIFAVRPGGMIVTSRHDTPAGSLDWHVRGSLDTLRAWQELRERYFDPGEAMQPRDMGIIFNPRRGMHREDNPLYEATRIGYFAKVDLVRLIDDEYHVVLDVSTKKRESPLEKLAKLIKYQRDYTDGTLDYADDIPVGGRGRVPSIRILGLSREKIQAFKDRGHGDTPETVYYDLKKVVNELREKRRVVGEVIIPLTLVEHIRRHRAKTTTESDADLLHNQWKTVFKAYLERDLGIGWQVRERIVSFWEKYSDQPNGAMDFSGIVTARVSTDPTYLHDVFQKVPPRGLVLQATGAAGMRLRRDFSDSYGPLLTLCRQAGIPVVLTASSRGEVTSFEYGPGREAMEDDFCFFAGTLDDDLVQPRMALLNAAENRLFLDSLVGKLDVPPAVKEGITRNMYRQLLSGSHYRFSNSDGNSDRDLIEEKYKIETRVDLLSGLHVRKAIFASYLHEVHTRGLPMPPSVADVLK